MSVKVLASSLPPQSHPPEVSRTPSKMEELAESSAIRTQAPMGRAVMGPSGSKVLQTGSKSHALIYEVIQRRTRTSAWSCEADRGGMATISVSRRLGHLFPITFALRARCGSARSIGRTYHDVQLSRIRVRLGGAGADMARDTKKVCDPATRFPRISGFRPMTSRWASAIDRASPRPYSTWSYLRCLLVVLDRVCSILTIPYHHLLTLRDAHCSLRLCFRAAGPRC